MALQVSRILHAGYLFETEKAKILFDPIFENPFSVNCYAFPAVSFELEIIQGLSFDAVFISHYHDDHCSFESLNLLKRDTPVYLYCVHDELFDLIRELGFQKVHSLIIGQKVEVGDFKITTHLALDEDVDSIFQIEVQGLQILNVVDSWIHPQTLKKLAAFSPWDLVLWPFQTMREIEVLTPQNAGPACLDIPAEWIEPLKVLHPRNVVPSSCQFRMEDWSWYNQAFFPITYKSFESQLNEFLPDTKVLRMNPSTSILIDQKTVCFVEPLSWIRPCGPQDVDYEYDPFLVPPSTSEIAQQLPTETPTEMIEQKMRVKKFCEEDLPTVDLGNISFWRLIVYDSQGEPLQYDFNNKKDSAVKPDWITEIPLIKLWGALEKGESLTSLYLRIDCDFSKRDLFEDPLIGRLYHGRFASYQKAQLSRLRFEAASFLLPRFET